MVKGKKKSTLSDVAATPISAMIDVVFLLIIFFVVTAAVDKDIQDANVSLANAPHGRPIAKKDPRSIVINVRKDGTTTVGMLPVTTAQISDILRNAASKYGHDIPIIIRGDKDVQHYYVQQVMNAVTDTGLYQIKFNTVIE